MVDSGRDTTDDPDAPALPPEQGGAAGGMREKSSFKKLEQGQKRRDKLVVVGVRVAVVVLVIMAVVVVAQMFISSDDAETIDTGDSKDIAVIDAPLQCDNVEDFAAVSDQRCKLKLEFQDKYKELATEFLPTIEGSAAEDFVREGIAEIKELEGEAIKAFDQSDFAAAIELVGEAIESVVALREAIAEGFQRSFENAESAFIANDADSAQNWIDRALRLNGRDMAAQDLSVRIAVLPEIIRLFQLAREAEVQNQLIDLQKHLQGIVALDPQRQDVSRQLAALEGQLKQAKYNGHLRKASQYLASENTRAARQEANKARALYPARHDSTALISQIDKIEQTRRINTLLQDAQTLAGQDDWAGALELYGRVLTEDSANRIAIDGRENSSKIVGTKSSITGILNNQHRLQDANVHQRTIEFVELFKPLSQDSPSLANLIATLEQRLDLWGQKVKVTVFSDGISMIIVRRVGRVGVLEQKDIQLKPGKYDFECSRDGFRSRIVEHFVPPGQNGTSVTIVCDVRI